MTMDASSPTVKPEAAKKSNRAHVKPVKVRLDRLLVDRGLAPSRQRARAMIMAGAVLVNNQPANKPGLTFDPDMEICIKGADMPYVSRGGLKLEKALREYHIDAKGAVCLDIGASTGGFTDCLLQHGAARVYAVDVGYGQLAWQLRQDKRVKVIERTNIRYMPCDRVADPIDLITIDVSFISLRIVIPAALQFVHPQTKIIALIKPQFEVGKSKVGKGGVVKDHALHEAVIADLSAYCNHLHLNCHAPIPSPIQGPKGNREFLMLMRLA